MAERGAIGRRLDELPMGVAVSVGVAAGVGAGAGLMVHGGVGALVGFCGAVGAAAGVALAGKPVAEVVPQREKREAPPRVEEAKNEAPAVLEPEAMPPAPRQDPPTPIKKVRFPGMAPKPSPSLPPKQVLRRIKMVRIPGGTFWMGSGDDDPNASDNERPRHQVTLSPFWMGRVPVTQNLYQVVVGMNPGLPAGDDLPINNVTWHDAIRFCNRLSEIAGLVPAYHEDGRETIWNREADGYRLPTEAEWEFAARGTDRRIYPWGNEPPSNQLCWNGPGNDLGQGTRDGPSQVGRYPEGASPFGLLDMAGNVWEWTADAYESYDKDPQQNPYKVANASQPRVLRGGSWFNQKASRMRATERVMDEPRIRDFDIGFRCARGSIQ